MSSSSWCLILSLICAAGTARAQMPDSYGEGLTINGQALALQNDGKSVIAGQLVQTNGSSQGGVWRLTEKGGLDTNFTPPSLSGLALAVQADGRILTEATLYSNYQSTSGIFRLYPDGTLDASFNAPVDGSVSALLLQPDGRVLVGGYLATLSDAGRNGLARLNGDGSLDALFTPSASGYVGCLAVQSDRKILAAGDLSINAAPSRRCVCRMNHDGSIDTLFQVAPVNYVVRCMAVQADGKILVGGDFTTLGGITCFHLGRLNEDGSVDTRFTPGPTQAACPYVSSLAIQANGRILVGGSFVDLGSQPCNNIGRLNLDGTLDGSFSSGANGSVLCVALQEDGKLLTAGTFRLLGGQPHNGIGRLSNTEPALEQLANGRTNITWLRGGSSPELSNVSFDASTNGADWTPLGSATRIPGGWQLSGLTLATNVTIRAFGFVAAGYQNGASWVVQSFAGLAFISSQPTNRFDQAGSSTGFDIQVVGTPPFSYQWYKDGVSLSDGENISGARNAVLTLADISAEDAGAYSVTISNACGSVFSRSAALAVADPFLGSHPEDQTIGAEQTVEWSVTAGGTPPLSFQWYKDGTALDDGGHISGARTPLLVLNNVLHSDIGGYSLVLTNHYGSVTSRVAELTVRDPFIVLPPLSQTTFSGRNVTLQIKATGTEPLAYQWRKNGTNLLASTFTSIGFPGVQPGDRGDYEVVISNIFGCVTSTTAMLTVNPVVSDAFAPRANDGVSAFVIQPDGKILVGGVFTSLGAETHPHLGRLNSDGSSDSTFNPSTDFDVYCLALQDDNKIIVGGMFNSLCGQPSRHLGRLNPDGSLDASFTVQADRVGPYADYVYSLARQPDGRILVGGAFTSLAGQPHSGIGRLNRDGTLDPTFHPACDGGISCLLVQPDGKIVVGGSFGLLDGTPRSCIGRFNPDGTLDAGFNAQAASDWYFRPSVSCLALQANGQILAGGTFTRLCGQSRFAIGRLNPDGTLDDRFNPGAWGGADIGMSALAVQADGRILAGGPFLTLAGQDCVYVGRLNSDGTLDPSFKPGNDGSDPMPPLALQADGKLLVGGFFFPDTGKDLWIGRLENTDPALQSLVLDGSYVTWLRDGTTPEVSWTTFEVSTNGSDWNLLGTGTRFPGGWQLGGVILPTNATVRAQGLVSGSSSIVESRLRVDPMTPPRILLDNSRVADGSSYLDLQGLAGQMVVVQTSTNLMDWNAVSTNALTTGRAFFTDRQNPFVSHRYYRLLLRSE